MKHILFCAVLLVVNSTSYSQLINPSGDLADYANPLTGTDSKRHLSNGNTYPVIARPWGMNFWTPQTNNAGDAFIYEYNKDQIMGFKQTHQASNWIGDYGQFAVMPGTGNIKFTEDARANWFTHKTEIARPYYYSVYLGDANTTAEFTTTERAAYFRFTFPETDSAYVVIDALDQGSYIRLIPEKNRLIGYSTKNKGSVPDNFKNYFVITFSKPFAFTYLFKDSTLVTGTELEAGHTGAVIGFKTKRLEKIEAKIASSFISYEQAEVNLKELGNDAFDAVVQKSKDIWNRELGRIQIEGATIDQARTFYTNLYRTMLFPRQFHEVTADNQVIHYSPFNGKVLPGYLFTDNGYFDTFRALFPLFSILYPDLYSKILQGMVNAYNESGWLPEWTSPGHHRHVTFGAYSAAIVADAYTKGIRGYDIDRLYEAIVKNTKSEPPPGISSVGRLGVTYYNRMGYVPYDAGIKENTARTIEYAYLDFTIYQLAKALKRPESEVQLFSKRSFNYKNHFDPSTGLMRGKNKDGSFQSPFDPFKWGDAFTEGNSWHYTWAPVNDIKGLMALMGGRKNFIHKLDSVCILPPVYNESWYGYVIHEIREMQIANMGQYVHGNQPMQHVAYLYNYAGEPWKSQYWVREIMDRLYNDSPAGYCGDEDTGQTSAWYILSALGFYPVTPGSGEYVLGSPLFRKATVKLPGNKILVMNAPGNSKVNRYIGKLNYNGKAYTKNWLSHRELMKGGKLDFFMQPNPEKSRGILDSDAPLSHSSGK
ncbi:MAG: GH92 family glycosyl hydrolase [Chitinophagaceae bacterium]|nr:GH92 family glycosyl hydrolase [Chitinophagaceae bacterium]